MKVFKVINKVMPFFSDIKRERRYNELIITLHQPPYEDENILNKTGWKAKDCEIVEITSEEIE